MENISSKCGITLVDINEDIQVVTFDLQDSYYLELLLLDFNCSYVLKHNNNAVDQVVITLEDYNKISKHL